MRKIAIIPTMMTLGNAVCGFAAIACASKIDFTAATEHYFAYSGWLLIAAMLFDALDGYVARLSRTASKFGGELDSLCDGISFGVAPAFLLLKMGPGWEPRPFLHQLLACIAALYMVCALLRLARFNVENSPDPAYHKKFRGLPSPGAAGCLATLAILRGALVDQWSSVSMLMNRWAYLDELHVRIAFEVFAPLGALAVALLMVSRVPYPHFTKSVTDLRGRKHFGNLIQFILLLFVMLMTREVALFVAFWIYGIGIPIRYMIRRSLHPNPGTSEPHTDDALRH